MKKFIIASLLSLIPVAAFADHTLQDTMNENVKIKAAVEAIVNAAGVSCDTASSEEDIPSEDVIKQTAYCYNPNGDGGVIGQLIVTYKWDVNNEIASGDITSIYFEVAN